MGATTFIVHSSGQSAAHAFSRAIDDAFWTHGREGYTGSICEKTDFNMMTPPKQMDLYEWIEEQFEGNDVIDDKWGPAGCVQISETSYVFFGWASC